jgi:membrane-associated PAP2 superfamily phosphatase
MAGFGGLCQTREKGLRGSFSRFVVWGMFNAIASKHDRRWRDLLVWIVLAAGLTPIFWLTDLDIRAAGVFFQRGHLDGPWFMERAGWVQMFYYAPPVLVGALLLAVVWGFVVGTLRPEARRWRGAAAFLLITLILGPGVLVNAVFKDHWGRPRPKHITEFDGTQTYRPPLLKGDAGTAQSFPAGHPSVAFAYAAVFLLLRPKRPRLAWVVFAFSTLIGVGMGAARMAAGGHFLSDVLWSALLTWWAAWFAYYFIVRVERESSSLLGSEADRRAERWKNLAMAAGVLVLVAGVLLATPTNKRSALNWPVTVSPPEAVLLVAPGAQVRVRVAGAETLPALGLRQSIQGFGLPGNHLKVRTDPLEPVATWKYTGLARGYYTELENTLEVTVRSGLRPKLQLQVGPGGRVILEGAAAELSVEADVPVVREAEAPAGSGAAD